MFLLQVVSLVMVTDVSVDYDVQFAVVVLDNPYRSCRLQLLVLLVIVPADYYNFCWSESVLLLVAIFGFRE